MLIGARKGTKDMHLLQGLPEVGSEDSMLTCVMSCAPLKLKPAAQKGAGTTPGDWLVGTQLAVSLSMGPDPTPGGAPSSLWGPGWGPGSERVPLPV